MSEWLGVELDWGGFVTGNRVSKISQQQEDQEDSLSGEGGELGEGEREVSEGVSSPAMSRSVSATPGSGRVRRSLSLRHVERTQESRGAGERRQQASLCDSSSRTVSR